MLMLASVLTAAESPQDATPVGGFTKPGCRSHEPWMDKMKQYGIKNATHKIAFVSNSGTPRLEFLETSYHSEYFANSGNQIEDPNLLAVVRSEGLEEELRRSALPGAVEAVENAISRAGFSRGFGTLYYEEADNECISVSASIPRIYDPDETELMRAAEEGNAERVRQLIQSGAVVNAKDQSGVTALYKTVVSGSSVIAKMLLDAGADPNVTTRSGTTPLMGAAWTLNRAIVRVLLDHGADVNLHEKDGRTALIDCASGADADPEIVEWLLEAGAEIDARDNLSETALSLAARTGSVPVVKTLLAAGADITVRDAGGMTALERVMAIENRKPEHTEIIRLLTQAAARKR
jgi:ankyrin repeat protein